MGEVNIVKISGYNEKIRRLFAKLAHSQQLQMQPILYSLFALENQVHAQFEQIHLQQLLEVKPSKQI